MPLNKPNQESWRPAVTWPPVKDQPVNAGVINLQEVK